MTSPERLIVGDGDAGARLDVFLAAPVGSRARAQALIDAGAVTVDGRPRPKRTVLVPGQVVQVAGAEPALPTQGQPDDAADGEGSLYTIAYSDEHLLVVDKAPGVVVHPARGHRSGTLAQALAGRVAGGEDASRAGIVHRLDRDTSGLLVVARSEAVHRALKDQLAHRRLRREYIALVEGHPSARTGTIEAPIGRDRRERTLMSIDTDQPKEARTHFEVERLLADSALLRVELDTGRTHQIRVHLAAIGVPVAGDPQYGSGQGRYGLERQFLHAARLAFTHPATEQPIEIRSPLPADLAAALIAAEHAD